MQRLGEVEVGQEMEEGEKMDEAVSLYFAGQSMVTIESTWEKLGLGRYEGGVGRKGL